MALSPLTIAFDKDRRLAYDGTQLRAHFLRHAFGIEGDGAAIFRGPCDVRAAHLVDLADRERNLFIFSKDMLHLIVERFDPDLVRGVLLQRLTTALIADLVRERATVEAPVARRGDDVYVGRGKLTVSIATVSPVSALLHFGINIDHRDTPVDAAGLTSLGIDPAAFSESLLSRLTAEVDSMDRAVCKVTPVGDYWNTTDAPAR